MGGSGFVGTMGPRSRLFVCFLLWGSTELCSPQPFWDDDLKKKKKNSVFSNNKTRTLPSSFSEARITLTLKPKTPQGNYRPVSSVITVYFVV